MKLTGWLNQKRYGLTKAFVIFFVFQGWAQPAILTLDSAYVLARTNYPFIKQKELLQQTTTLTTRNLQTNYFPQVSFAGQATYQSDVTKVDVPLPGFSFNAPSRDQYKIYTDVSQLIYDGGITRQQKEWEYLNAAVKDQQVEVELYKVKERINQLYLTVLYMDAQRSQVKLVNEDLHTGLEKVTAQVEFGVAFRSNLNLLKAEILKNEQRLIELNAARHGLLQVLGLYINQSIPDDVVLEQPAVHDLVVGHAIKRPEIQLFQDQEKLAKQQQHIIRAKNLPKASLFVQGGYGRPALNMLEDSFNFYYIGGVRFHWNLGNLYNRNRELRLAELNEKSISIQQETFELNTRTSLQQQQSEIEKYRLLLSTDEAIIELRQQVKDAAKAQLASGVITANDYLREVNAEDQARQLLITHQIQLLQAQVHYQLIIGNE